MSRNVEESIYDMLLVRDKMSIHFRGPSIYPFYQVSVHLAKWFQRRRFIFILTSQKQELPIAVMCYRPDPLTNIAALCKSCFWLVNLKTIFSYETDWPNKLTLRRKHLWQVIYKECSYCPDPLTNMAALDNYWTSHISFLPSFCSFGQVVSEEKIYFYFTGVTVASQ
jgi:hypothetical protein